MAANYTSLEGANDLAWGHVKRTGADAFNRYMGGVQTLPIFVVKKEGEKLFLHQAKTGKILGGIKGFEDTLFDIDLSGATVKKKIYLMGYAFNFVYNRYKITTADGTTIELHVPKNGKRFLKSFNKVGINVSVDAVADLNTSLKAMKQ
ncbi:MAG: hypothetical protein JXJ04_06090 [Spirochaetales bacterium]|nr:hypothetical protein [Spirochaetales bacterium]